MKTSVGKMWASRPNLALLWAGLLAGGWLGAAPLAGRVVLRGPPPPEIPVDLTSFPDCRGVRQQPLTTRHYIVGTNGGLANVFVHVREGVGGKTFPTPTNTVLLDQYQCGFHPYMLGLQTNQTLVIKNSEPYLETVHATSFTNKGFNIAQQPGMISRFKFTQPEVLIRVKCEIHPWEFAFIGVVDHPFFAVTDARGHFEISTELPAGKYVIETIHQKLGRQTREVTIAAGTPPALDFIYESKAQTKP